jgi:hypothetical protein
MNAPLAGAREFCNRLASWLERRGLFFSLVLVLTAIPFLSALILLPPSKTWTTITAESQFISYQVTIGEYDTFRAGGMRARTEDGMDFCVDGFVQPASGSRVEYRASSKASLRIIIDPSRDGHAVRLIPASRGATRDISSSFVLIADPTCLGTPPDTLPIWGAAVVGDSVRPTGATGEPMPGLLLSGEVVVFARAHDRFLGIRLPALVYRVTSFTLPPASSVKGFASDREEAVWRGIARFGTEGGALQVMLAGEPSGMEISVPGDAGAFAVGKIDMGSYAEFLKDPNLLTIQAVFAILLYLVKLAHDAASRLPGERRDRSDS